jgi:hypothetical protein
LAQTVGLSSTCAIVVVALYFPNHFKLFIFSHTLQRDWPKPSLQNREGLSNNLIYCKNNHIFAPPLPHIPSPCHFVDLG